MPSNPDRSASPTLRLVWSEGEQPDASAGLPLEIQNRTARAVRAIRHVAQLAPLAGAATPANRDLLALAMAQLDEALMETMRAVLARRPAPVRRTSS
jgi:hypothetical protein